MKKDELREKMKEIIERIKKGIEEYKESHPICEFLLKNGECVVFWDNNWDKMEINLILQAFLFVKFNGKYYRMIYSEVVIPHLDDPEIISEEEVKKILSKNPKSWEEARRLGWWREDLFEYFGIKVV
jgi:predicted secreted protein